MFPSISFLSLNNISGIITNQTDNSYCSQLEGLNYVIGNKKQFYRRFVAC